MYNCDLVLHGNRSSRREREQLDSIVYEIPNHDIILITGDMDAKVGSGDSKKMISVGQYGIGTANDNEERLRTCSEIHNLITGDTWFSHKDLYR